MVKKNFYKNIETGEIFKETSDNVKYLKVSPWKTGEDRCISIDNLKKLEVEGKVTKIPCDIALEELNKIWNKTDRYWTHDGNEYKSLSKIHISGKHSSPVHTFVHNMIGINGVEYTFQDQYHLVMFQGHLYWANLMYSYLHPQQRICQFEGIDVIPNSDKGQWTNIKNLHPIYVKDKTTGDWKMI